MNKVKRNWLNSINWQVDFYQRSNKKRRNDLEFPWTLVDSKIAPPVKILRALANRSMNMFGLRSSKQKLSLEWLNSNAEPLWESRSLLNDELSRLLFDLALVLRLTGYRQFYFPRLYFDDLIDVVDEKPFQNSDLPRDFLGIPLKLFEIRLREYPSIAPLKIVASNDGFNLLNSYRHYLLQRNSINISPLSGDIVLDCGAGIGDISLLFAGLVGRQGEVHLFDPIPLHIRFCRLQASLNPPLAQVLHINELAVSNRTFAKAGVKRDSDRIAPAGLAIDSFASTSLDEYASSKLSRVDFIKMDIEGAEMDAIEGAAKIIREFKPRLAISVYHKPNDLWQIPLKLKALNPTYEMYFGHHTPVSWESVFYAVQR